MKIQIQRFSLHQNAKVISIMMAITATLFLVPFFLIFLLVTPNSAQLPFTSFIPMLLMPLVYLIVGYITSLIGLALYNALVPKMGPLEYDADVTRP